MYLIVLGGTVALHGRRLIIFKLHTMCTTKFKTGIAQHPCVTWKLSTSYHVMLFYHKSHHEPKKQSYALPIAVCTAQTGFCNLPKSAPNVLVFDKKTMSGPYSWLQLNGHNTDKPVHVRTVKNSLVCYNTITDRWYISLTYLVNLK